MTKRNLARDVLQRLARSATRDETAQNIAFLHGERALEIDVEVDAAQTRGLGKEPLGREASMLVSLALEKPHGPVKRRLIVQVSIGFGHPRRRLLQLAGTVGGLQGGDDVTQVVAQKHAVVGGVEADAMVGHAVLGAVVGADFLGTVARTDLGQALSAFGGLLLGEHLLIKARAQNGHSRDLVLQLDFWS